MKTLTKIVTFIALVTLTIFGAYVLYIHGDFIKMLPSKINKNNIISNIANIHNQNKNPKENPTSAFQEPKVGKPGEIFIHENGFEIGKNQFKTQTTKETVVMEKGRVKQVSYKTNKDSVFLYTIGQEDTKAFAKHKLTDNGEKYYFSGQAWEHNIHPYFSSIASWANENKQDVIIVIDFEYTSKDDIAAEYITLRAFSAKDLGKSLSVNTTFHQYADQKILDYKTLDYVREKPKEI